MKAKLKQRVEKLEEMVMPTFVGFFIELDKVDHEYCVAFKAEVLRALDSPDTGKINPNPTKGSSAAFLIRTIAVMKDQADPEKALPLPEFRERLSEAIRQLAA
ncbi:MAG: hypothetical protein JEZ11_07110 [Desulfobacterales bacterium]|nr:hypothetical protein [Desulfobacterales bacterium]